jgi:hypothetical protein
MRRTAVLVVLAGLFLSLSVAPASAGRATIRDEVQPRLPAEMDILRMKIVNGERRVVLKLKFRDLAPDRRARSKVLIDPRPRDDTQYLAYSVRRPGKGTVTELQIATDLEFGGEAIPCAGMVGRWSMRRDTLRFRVPQRCLVENGRVHRFKAIAGFWGNRGDFTRFRNVRRG